MLWRTGNGWAAAGMLRVLVTILNSPYAGQMKAQTDNLTSWIIEIVEKAFDQVSVRSTPSLLLFSLLCFTKPSIPLPSPQRVSSQTISPRPPHPSSTRPRPLSSPPSRTVSPNSTSPARPWRAPNSPVWRSTPALTQ